MKLVKLKVVKTRNGGTWTESQYWGSVRSHLRRMFRFNWVPAKTALENAKRKSQSPNPRLKFEYVCAHCKAWFPRKEVELDHIVPCGCLKSLSDLPGFLERLHPETPQGYQVICKPCHHIKTGEERTARKAA